MLRYKNGRTLKEIQSCEHRGGRVGVKKKPNCGCKGQDVYSCALYQLCTIKKNDKSQTEKVCIECTECSPKSSN